MLTPLLVKTQNTPPCTRWYTSSPTNDAWMKTKDDEYGNKSTTSTFTIGISKRRDSKKKFGEDMASS